MVLVREVVVLVVAVVAAPLRSLSIITLSGLLHSASPIARP